MRAGKQDVDWRMIRMDVSHLCYEASLLLEAGKELKDLRPRPLTSDLKTIRDDLVRVLVGWDWRSLPGVDRELHEIFVNNLLVALCQQEGPVFSELNPIGDNLIRFLAGRDWWSLPASFRGPIPTEVRQYDMIAICSENTARNDLTF
jgi:hypothetical protein